MTLVHQNLPLPGKGLQIFHYIPVFFHLYALGGQISGDPLVQRALLDEQDCAVFRQISVGHGHGIALHVAAPDIEEPHQIVQLCQEECVRALFLQLLQNLAPLLFKTLSCDLLVQHGHLPRREGRSVRPDPLCQILVIYDGNLLVGELFLILFSGLGRNHPAVKAQGLALLHILHQEFRDCRNALLPHAVQGDRGTLQLLLRLDKVSAVRPQARALLPYHQGAVGS